MKKQLLLMMVLMLTCATAWGQTFNIGGHRAVRDTINNMWLCSIPQSHFGEDYIATVSFGDDVTDLAIEGEPVANGDEVTFAQVAGGTHYTVTGHMGDSLITGYITFTWLPLVEINGEPVNKYVYGTVTVSEPDSAFAEPMLAKMKLRGGATNTPDKHKRNYRIKFINEDSTKCNRRFFGLRNDNNWILDAGQMDFLRVRNRVSTDLWLDMSRKPWYSDSIANVRNGSRGQMVEVIMNGGYVGIYNMCEPIDRKQLKLERYDYENREFHGLLWTAYKWTRTVTMSDPVPRPGGVYWDGFEQKYPDFSEIRRTKWDPLENAVYFAGRADEDMNLRVDSMGEYFDLPVMQDYYIYIVALQALDNESKNIYYSCLDLAGSHRLTMTPWDLDVCLGGNYNPRFDLPEMVRPDRPVDWISHVPMFDMMQVKSYRSEVIDRYRELRNTWLETENLVSRYRSAVNELLESGAAEREENRWSGDTDLANKELNLANEMDYVENWIRNRMAYCDEHVFIEPFIKGDVNGDGEVTIADVNMIIEIILGHRFSDEIMNRADVNEDLEITIGDINAVIEIILKKAY